jgi:2'-hydroxyisoflavone reductase
MNVLVIGGSRFLNYHLTSALISAGIKVTLFNRGISPDDFGNQVSRIMGNRGDFNNFYHSLKGKHFDVVIDLIGYTPDEVEVVEKTFCNSIGQYIFISTGQVYLVTRNEHLPSRKVDIYQDLIPCPPGEEEAYDYGVNKRAIELFLEKCYKENSFPTLRLRCPIIHGPRDYTLRFYSYLLRINDGYPLFIPETGDTIIRHVYVGDVVNTIMTALHDSRYHGKVYNLAQKEVLKLSQFLELSATFLGKTVEIVKLTQKEFAQYQLPSDISPFSGRWVSYMDTDLAMRELGFMPTPPDIWIPLVARYFLEKYAGPQPDNYRNRQREIDVIDKLQIS